MLGSERISVEAAQATTAETSDDGHTVSLPPPASATALYRAPFQPRLLMASASSAPSRNAEPTSSILAAAAPGFCVVLLALVAAALVIRRLDLRLERRSGPVARGGAPGGGAQDGYEAAARAAFMERYGRPPR